jgi:hypothetical protein
MIVDEHLAGKYCTTESSLSPLPTNLPTAQPPEDSDKHTCVDIVCIMSAYTRRRVIAYVLYASNYMLTNVNMTEKHIWVRATSIRKDFKYLAHIVQKIRR